MLWPKSCGADPGGQGFPGLLGDLELHRSLGLPLHHDRARGDDTRRRDVVNFQRDQIAPRSLLSIARLNSARSRARRPSCSRTWIAQISLAFRGGFWPRSLVLLHAPGLAL